MQTGGALHPAAEIIQRRAAHRPTVRANVAGSHACHGGRSRAGPRDMDVATIFGSAFPRHRGGLLYWADGVVPLKSSQMLEPLSLLGPRAAPTRLLADMARDGTRFY